MNNTLNTSKDNSPSPTEVINFVQTNEVLSKTVAYLAIVMLIMATFIHVLAVSEPESLIAPSLTKELTEQLFGGLVGPLIISSLGFILFFMLRSHFGSSSEQFMALTGTNVHSTFTAKTHYLFEQAISAFVAVAAYERADWIAKFIGSTGALLIVGFITLLMTAFSTYSFIRVSAFLGVRMPHSKFLEINFGNAAIFLLLFVLIRM
ncbi:hypothetical protein [Vibrio mediterranei]|uniref:hypothetical protein n=1 Tax=Vibrio mediterranei TaxID=689 RepID=UPI0040681865